VRPGTTWHFGLVAAGLTRRRGIPGYRAGVESLSRRTLGTEVLLVLGVSLGQSGVFALLSLISALTKPQPLSQQTQTVVQSVTPDRPWLDLAIQLASIGFGVVPALMAVHLLRRDRDSAAATLGLVPRRVGFDLGTGAALAALIGVPGLGLYYAARALGLNVNVVPTNLSAAWWTVPVLLLAAVENGVLEEVVVVGYLTTRLSQIGWRPAAIVAASALLRGSYHLYQGFGAFVGNAVMGVVFTLFFLRLRRVGPLVVAHTLLDTVAFVGYALLYRYLPFLS
jgi:membrane protease YdiL (CAAX protease family)